KNAMIVWSSAPLLSPAGALLGMEKKANLHRSSSKLNGLFQSSERLEGIASPYKMPLPPMGLYQCFKAIKTNDPELLAKEITSVNPERRYPGIDKTLFQAHTELMDTLRAKNTSYLNTDFQKANRILSILLVKAAFYAGKQ
ncbi:MAG TPA: hypothetical protein VI521_01430, partial [Candidatus Babeliales bacterium]|nr:hypothetical protein [Candidatus Babeliales bacterium]